MKRLYLIALVLGYVLAIAAGVAWWKERQRGCELQTRYEALALGGFN